MWLEKEDLLRDLIDARGYRSRLMRFLGGDEKMSKFIGEILG